MNWNKQSFVCYYEEFTSLIFYDISNQPTFFLLRRNIYPVSMMLHLKIQQFQRNFKQVDLAGQNFSRKVLSLI